MASKFIIEESLTEFDGVYRLIKLISKRIERIHPKNRAQENTKKDLQTNVKVFLQILKGHVLVEFEEKLDKYVEDDSKSLRGYGLWG